MQVSCLGANQNMPQATFESASCIITGSIDIINSLLEKTKRYDQELGGWAGDVGLGCHWHEAILTEDLAHRKNDTQIGKRTQKLGLGDGPHTPCLRVVNLPNE